MRSRISRRARQRVEVLLAIRESGQNGHGDPHGDSCLAQLPTASRRRSGLGARGSSILARRVRRVVTLRFTLSDDFAAMRFSSSMSRTTWSDFVVIERLSPRALPSSPGSRASLRIPALLAGKDPWPFRWRCARPRPLGGKVAIGQRPGVLLHINLRSNSAPSSSMYSCV